MNLNDERTTHYDVLDLKPDASPHQIREAYLRAKATYHKDSAALYTLITPEEREEMLGQIEEAYRVLSNPQKRKEYDRKYGFVVSFTPDDLAASIPRPEGIAPPPIRKIISIDRIPPMETFPDHDSALVAPAMPSPASPPARPAELETVPAASPAPAVAAAVAQVSPPSSTASVGAMIFEDALQKQIDAEIEWSGAFLKKVREANGISIEEIANITKINKNYLFAIEDENYAKLPAAVYVRGFVTQMSKLYRIPIERVVNAYMNRLILAREPKKK